MTAAAKWNLIAVDEYLAAERDAPAKHEYVGGVVYAMAGARIAHNRIAGNLYLSLGVRLRPGPCEPFNSDTKIRIRLATHTRFYYPDVSIVCRSNGPDETFQDEPAALFEVLAEATRRIDAGEKKDAYLTIPSLQVYALIEQAAPTVVVFRRTADGFVREIYAGLDAVIPLREFGIDLPLAEIYERVEFQPEPVDEA